MSVCSLGQLCSRSARAFGSSKNKNMILRKWNNFGLKTRIHRQSLSIISPKEAITSIDDNVVKHLFQSFAVISKKNNIPVLNRLELLNLLESIGVTISDEKLDELFYSIDEDNNGELDYAEFSKEYKQVLKKGEMMIDHRAIFDLIDRQKRGRFTIEDLAGSLTTSGKITKSEAHMIMKTIDVDNDETINFREFSQMIHLNPDSSLGTPINDKIFCWKLLSLFRVVFVVGGPASGKGTICGLLVKKAPMKILHVSSGDLLRDEIETGSLLGQQIAETMRKGQLCDATVVITLLKKILYRSPGRLVLLDGFPRSLENAKDFVEQFGMGECCLFFDCPRDVMISRILERGKNSGRIDDNEITAVKRIATFESQSREPLQYFKSLGSPIVTLDTTKSAEENLDILLNLEIFSPNKE